MGYPVAHVGSIVRVGSSKGQVITGGPAHQVGGQGNGGSSGMNPLQEVFESIGMETEDMSPSQRRAYVTERYGSGAADAYERGLTDETPPTESETVSPTEQRSATVGCNDIPDDAPNTYRISPSFTVASFTVGDNQGNLYQAPLRHRLPPRTALGLSRKDVICNLKFLSNNTLEPLKAWVAANTQYYFVIGSGFRNATTGSDHNRGQAADLHFFSKQGRARVSREALRAVVVRIVNEANIPYTQLILEYDGSNSRGWLHLANRRSGNSGLRLCHTFNASRRGLTAGLPNRA